MKSTSSSNPHLCSGQCQLCGLASVTLKAVKDEEEEEEEDKQREQISPS